MRYIVKKGKDGFSRRYLVPDNVGDDQAEKGIPSGPPDIREIDIEAVLKEINQRMVEQGLFTWKDINLSPVGLSVICTVFKRHIAGLYKDEATRQKQVNT